MTEEDYLLLCDKFLAGNCSKEEVSMLLTYQKENGLDQDFDELAKDPLRQILFDRVQQSIQGESPKRLWTGFPVLRIAASVAAVLLIFFFAARVFIKKEPTAKIAKVNTVKAMQHDISPGSQTAVLTLADGKQIQLDEKGNGLLNDQHHVAILKSGEGIVLTAKDKAGQASSSAFNKISIPRAGKYNITLSDGTKVWLNSSSTLSFPAVFSGKKRKVLLEGEAYFEVAKNKTMPFIIEVNGKQEVEVLGTHFNISAFEDDKQITTTLLEGSVKVNYKNKHVLIKPGEMVVNNLQDKLSVKPADLEEIMAWKNEMFIFSNENITSVMKKISRWYDVEVSYQGNMDGINIDGNYSRAKGLKTLLKNIELLDQVDFSIKERRITVIAK